MINELTTKHILNEKMVVQAWQNDISSNKDYVDTTGQPLEILYPGMLNNTRGGDFRDAVIRINDHFQYGNIEIHSRTSGWQAHRHHLNPDYNRTVLHVASIHDSARQTITENGKPVPTIIIKSYHQTNQNRTFQRQILPCSNRTDTDYKLICLEKAGKERFKLKMDCFQCALKTTTPLECFYRAIMEALGYSSNKQPFIELAENFPLEKLINTTKGFHNKKRKIKSIQSVLLGSAGLLPYQRNLIPESCTYINFLEKFWSESMDTQKTISTKWELYKIRPVNHPVRRIIAASHLINIISQPDFLNILQKTLKVNNLHSISSELIKILTVPGTGYWLDHYDFGITGNKPPAALLGRERINDIIINVILPYFSALNLCSGNPDRENQMINIFCKLTRSSGNSIERHMLKQLNLALYSIKTAALQQGLIHLFQTYCSRGKCSECLLSR